MEDEVIYKLIFDPLYDYYMQYDTKYVEVSCMGTEYEPPVCKGVTITRRLKEKK